MKTQHAIIVGIAIIIGMTLHALILQAPPQPPQLTQQPPQENLKELKAFDIQAKMLEVHPKSIHLGNESLLYYPIVSYRNGWVDMDYHFYRLIDGRLHKVSFVEE